MEGMEGGGWGFAFVLFYKTFWAVPRDNKFICSPLGLLQNWADGEVTLLRSSEWNNTFFTGTPPFGLHPCLYSDVPTGLFVCLVSTRHFGRVGKGDAPTEFYKVER